LNFACTRTRIEREMYLSRSLCHLSALSLNQTSRVGRKAQWPAATVPPPRYKDLKSWKPSRSIPHVSEQSVNHLWYFLYPSAPHVPICILTAQRCVPIGSIKPIVSCIVQVNWRVETQREEASFITVRNDIAVCNIYVCMYLHVVGVRSTMPSVLCVGKVATFSSGGWARFCL
jgi:hypothetical protein